MNKILCEKRISSEKKTGVSTKIKLTAVEDKADLHSRGRRVSGEKLAVVFENGYDDKSIFKSEVEDCVTSDEFSQVSSVYRSDSAKFSETDAEPVSSETESSYKLDIQTMSERSFESAKLSTRSAAYDVESPHTDATEYSVSHIESIIEGSYETKSHSECQVLNELQTDFEEDGEEKYSVEFSEHSMSTTSPSTTVKTQKSRKEMDSITRDDYEVHREDIEMKGDVLKITMRREDAEKSAKMKSATSVTKTRKIVKKTSDTKDELKTHRGFSPGARVKQVKAESDADVSSDDERKDHLIRGKILKKTSSSKSSSEIIRDKTYIPRLIKSPIRKVYSSDSTSTDTAATTTKRYEPKRKQKTTTVPPRESPKPPQLVRKYDNRVHGYMQSTVSRDMKIDKSVKEMMETKKSAPYTLYKTKDKKESENIKEKSKQSPRAQTPKSPRSSVEKRESKTSTEKKTYKSDTTKTRYKTKETHKTTTETQRESRSIAEVRKDVRVSKESSARKKARSPAVLEKSKEAKDVRDTICNGLPTPVVKTHKIEMVPKIESPKPSASPTKLKRAMPVEDHIRKVSISDRLSSKPSVKPSEIDKPVQDAEASHSRSVTPSTHAEKPQGHVERTPSSSSLPGSPVRVRSANGGTKVLTSEVFTRSHDHAGSIEVIYKQPYDNLKKVASGLREAEFSMIDTTDSSLSESVALPSSPSDHDISSEANGKFKSISPSSPKRRSLDSIHEMKHRVSDLITCALIPEHQGTEDFEEIQRRFALQGKEEALTDLPRRLLSQFEDITDTDITAQMERQPTVDPFRTGTTISVLPETTDVSTHSMAYTVTKEVYVNKLHFS
ncbi:hypothetical protein QE152_g1081 [Popillia japonica]|uniref:Uncharacterized protein n=1 Tax=Popillia japonica TaxID=7064 RepID=A0AAW1N7X7_POPJA